MCHQRAAGVLLELQPTLSFSLTLGKAANNGLLIERIYDTDMVHPESQEALNFGAGRKMMAVR